MLHGYVCVTGAGSNFDVLSYVAWSLSAHELHVFMCTFTIRLLEMCKFWACNSKVFKHHSLSFFFSYFAFGSLWLFSIPQMETWSRSCSCRVSVRGDCKWSYTSGHKSASNTGDDDDDKAMLLTHKSYCLHLIHAHLCATGTVFEVSDCTSYCDY